MIQQLLLAGQFVLVLVIYLFVWRVLTAARNDIAGSGRTAGVAAAESTIIPAADVARARRSAGMRDPRIVVAHSSLLSNGAPFVVSGTVTIGRASDNTIALDEPVVSSHHCRITAPNTLVDLESTNGTLVNDLRIAGRHALAQGDRITIGSTTFIYEAPR